MAIFDTLNPGALAAGMDPGLLGEFLTGTVSVHPAATLAGSLLAFFAVSALSITAFRQKRRLKSLEGRHDDAMDRLQAIELLLADSTSEASLLRQRVEQLGMRQENTMSSSARTSLRQAIALSRHGATTRQLIDTCELSQGEAHLIQTLYGQAAGARTAEELH
jgi:Protein of unknown function (DUF2802)